MDEKEWKIGDWPFDEAKAKEYQQKANYYVSSGKFFTQPSIITTTDSTSTDWNTYTSPFGPTTATSITIQQQQQAANMKYWQQMINQIQQDPREEERKLLSEIRQRAQYYAMMLLMECGVPA